MSDLTLQMLEDAIAAIRNAPVRIDPIAIPYCEDCKRLFIVPKAWTALRSWCATCWAIELKRRDVMGYDRDRDDEELFGSPVQRYHGGVMPYVLFDCGCSATSGPGGLDYPCRAHEAAVNALRPPKLPR